MSAEARSEYHYVLTSQMIWVDAECIYLMKHKYELLKGSTGNPKALFNKDTSEFETQSGRENKLK